MASSENGGAVGEGISKEEAPERVCGGARGFQSGVRKTGQGVRMLTQGATMM